MTTACPRCSRPLSDTGAEVAFCMYCGQRLRGSDGSADAAATQAFRPADTPAAEPQLTRVGRYRLVRFLGAGGMGQVYEAEAEDTGERVAVKLLSGRLAGNPQSVERFRQEGRVASQISHPNCVFVLAADASAGRPFIVMELMPGRTLQDVVAERGPLPVGEAVGRILDVIDGLAAAHRLGVIHRDVKPSNCFVTADDRVKVGDFGLSKSLDADGDGSLTGTGTFLGTVLYASPEQIRGEPVGYESDVYAVCGTLYHLLAGRAPYQHDSLTAALAKAVSEPAPSVRARRPEVPRELDRVIRRGLDRDRANRFPSLDDLGDALRALQPERAVPARVRLLVLAYLTDLLILQILILPVELVRHAVAPPASGDFTYTLTELGWPGLVLTILYFWLFEGLTGTTPGKNLLRLRVEKIGRPGPPGLTAVALRAVVFNAVWWLMVAAPEVLAEGLPSAVGWPLAGLAFAGCAVALLWQVRASSGGWRGVHDFAAGTRTVQRPRPAERVRLTSRFPDPLARGTDRTGLPAHVGGFLTTGRLAPLADGGEVWAAEDRGLGRRLLVRVYPAGSEACEPPTGPGRLRAVGSGELADGRCWEAFAAPAGSPLADLATPDRPLSWAEARPVLEQLAGVAADPAVRLEQVWVEPTGRVQVADFPLPPGSRRTGAGDPTPGRLLREAVTVLLEGHPRAAGGPVRAPLPPHASAVVNPLFEGGSPDRFAAALADTRPLPPAVTPGMRAAQLGVQALFLSLGLLLVFSLGPALALGQAFRTAVQADAARQDLTAFRATTDFGPLLAAADRLGPGEVRDAVLTAVRPDRRADTDARLAAAAERADAVATRYRRQANKAERAVLTRLQRLRPDATPPAAVDPARLHRLLARPDPAEPTGQFGTAAGAVLAVPLGWALFAVLFRGGLSMRLGGLVPVRADGRLAGRLRCGLRELLVWLPVAGLLLMSLWVQVSAPHLVTLRTGLWLTAALLLPAFVLIALRTPARPPHDRLVGTWLVPA